MKLAIRMCRHGHQLDYVKRSLDKFMEDGHDNYPVIETVEQAKYIPEYQLLGK